MIGYVIYLIGYIIAYILLRKDFRKEMKGDYSWEAVFWVSMLSMFSWIASIVVLINLLDNKKPPKWL